MPCIVFEFVQFVSLPVDRDYGLICGVGNGRHLKGKYVVFKFIVSFSQRVCLSIVKEGLIRELAVKASNYKNFGAACFANTATLPSRE